MPREPEVEDAGFTAAVEEWPKDGQFPSTANIRDQVNDRHGTDYDRKTIYRRLKSLASEGRINMVEVGTGRGRTIGWLPNGYEIAEVNQSRGRNAPPPVEERTHESTTRRARQTGNQYVGAGLVIALSVAAAYVGIDLTTTVTLPYFVGAILFVLTFYIGLSNLDHVTRAVRSLRRSLPGRAGVRR